MDILRLARRTGFVRSNAAIGHPPLAALGARVILPRQRVRALPADASVSEAPFDDYEGLRLALGIPDVSRDLVPEKSIMLESGFDELNGVDWQKGCYTGQELTARTKVPQAGQEAADAGPDRGAAPPPGAM